MTWPQPHEGINELLVHDQDELLSMNDAVRQALMAVGKHLHSATLVGNPAPTVKAARSRITTPQVGDLVFEESNIYFYQKDQARHRTAIGILIAERREWWDTDEEWESLLAEGAYDQRDERPVDHAWYIQYEPNAYCRWVNCSIVTIPRELVL